MKQVPGTCFIMLLVAAIEFQLAVARDDNHGGRIRTDIGERGILVDSGLQGRNALLLADVVVGTSGATRMEEFVPALNVKSDAGTIDLFDYIEKE